MRTPEQREADLEAEIDATVDRIVGAKTEGEAQSWYTNLAVLMRRRSTDQHLKLELQRRVLQRRGAVPA